MLAAFCLRLALGMVAFLPLLPADKMHPRFFRTQFLTALGLSVVALMSEWGDSSFPVRLALVGACLITLVSALIWTLEPPILGRLAGVLATVILGLGVIATTVSIPSGVETMHSQTWRQSTDAVVSGLFLGAAVTAMLVGHSYLISPGLTMTPLMTIIGVLGFCLVARITCSAVWLWAARSQDVWHIAVEPHLYLLLPRWLIGFAGPLVFGIMAYLSARIRSTQSATGILFVVVICTFLGELMSLVLTRQAGWPL